MSSSLTPGLGRPVAPHQVQRHAVGAPGDELQERAHDPVLPGGHEHAVGVGGSPTRPSAIENPRSVSVARQAAASASARRRSLVGTSRTRRTSVV